MSRVDHLLKDSVTVVTPAIVTDDHGNAHRVWTSVDGAERRTYRAYLEQQASKEESVAGEPWVTEFLLVLSDKAQVGPDDRVEIGSEIYEIVGLPELVVSALSRASHHWQMKLRLSGGGT